MCGSVALLNDTIELESAVRSALKLLEARGPDGNGISIVSGGALGHCRLSLRDADGGAQPMKLADGRTLAYVGELYNEHMLRNLLQLNGKLPRTASDTETLAHAIEQWGDQAWKMIEAMFAVMLLSPDGSVLQLIRDRHGVKPIFFARGASTVAAASQPSALREFGYGQVASLPALVHYLRTSQVCFHEQSVWSDIQLTPPGSIVTLGLESANHATWADELTFNGEEPTDPAQHSRLTALLNEAVYRQSQADTPVGVFLSGGIDSSLLAALLANMLKNPVRTFAIGLQHDTEDLRYAQVVAKHIRSVHEQVVLTPDEFFRHMRELTAIRALPVSLPNEVLIYRLSLQAKNSVKAVLSGEGADELFGGYHRLQVRLRNRNREDTLRAYRDNTAWFSANDLANALQDQTAVTECLHNDSMELQRLLKNVPAHAAVRSILLKDHFPHLLLRLDGASMAGSIEGRVPFTDSDIVRFAAQLHDKDLAPAFGMEKPILRKSALGLLPEEVLRRPKRAFSASLATLFESNAGQLELFNSLSQPVIAKLFDAEKLEKILSEDRESQVFHRTWLICSLGMWSDLCRVSQIN